MPVLYQTGNTFFRKYIFFRNHCIPLKFVPLECVNLTHQRYEKKKELNMSIEFFLSINSFIIYGASTVFFCYFWIHVRAIIWIETIVRSQYKKTGLEFLKPNIYINNGLCHPWRIALVSISGFLISDRLDIIFTIIFYKKKKII